MLWDIAELPVLWYFELPAWACQQVELLGPMVRWKFGQLEIWSAGKSVFNCNERERGCRGDDVTSLCFDWVFFEIINIFHFTPTTPPTPPYSWFKPPHGPRVSLFFVGVVCLTPVDLVRMLQLSSQVFSLAAIQCWLCETWFDKLYVLFSSSNNNRSCSRACHTRTQEGIAGVVG